MYNNVKSGFVVSFATALFVLGMCHGAFAQTYGFMAGKWGLEAQYIGGRFLNHGAKYNPADPSHGFEVAYFKKTLGEKPWHRGMNFPEVGAAFTYFAFADRQVFGNAVSFMGTAKFFLVRSKVVNLYVKMGSGYGFLTRRYDAAENPNNSLISSPINMAVMLRAGLEWKLSKHVHFNTAVSFHHFSNSGAHLPNIGLNMPNVTLGLKVFPRVQELNYNCEKPTGFKRNELIWKISIGIQQLHKVADNVPVSKRKYPVPGGMLAYARYINPGNKVYMGLSVEHFPAVKEYITSNHITPKHSLAFESTVPSVVVGDEFVFGWVSMFYSAGVYLWRNTATVSPVYFKAGMNLYFVTVPKKRGIRFFFGNNVKAHTNVAQYNDLNIGGTF